MARRKTTTPTLETQSGPTQIELGQLITGALTVHSNMVLAELFENAEGLEFSRETMVNISTIVKACTEKSIDSTLDQLLKYY